MLVLDEGLMTELGLETITGQARQEFLRDFRNLLELRVGMAVALGMDDAMLEEFGMFVDGDMPRMRQWLARACLACGLETRELIEGLLAEGDAAKLSALGALLWLTANKPDYAEIVTREYEALKHEAKARQGGCGFVPGCHV
jgi:hypothetical protein